MSGPNGIVDYPAYIKSVHMELLGYDEAGTDIEAALTDHMLGVVNAMLTVTNPYSSKSPYAPATDLDTVRLRIDEFASSIYGSNELVMWAAMLGKVDDNIDVIVPTDAEIEAAVVAYDNDAQLQLAQSYNRVCAVFQDNLAVVGTTFPTYAAILEAQHMQNVASYRAKLQVERNKDRVTAYLQSITSMTQIMSLRLQGMSGAVQLQDNFMRFKVASLNNQISQEVDMRAEEAYWDLHILDGGSRLIGATAGIPGMSRGMSKWQMGLNTVSTVASIFTGGMGAMGGGMSSLLSMAMLFV